MRGPRSVYLVAALGAALLAAAVGAHALEGLGGPLAAGEAHYVEVSQTDRSGLLAGLISANHIGLFGMNVDEHPATDGWVLAHPEALDVDEGVTARVVDDVPFEDPNGGTWLQQRVQIDGRTAWVVPVDVPRYDATLDGRYNFALVVDWALVPGEAELAMTYLEDLELVDDV